MQNIANSVVEAGSPVALAREDVTKRLEDEGIPVHQKLMRKA